MSTRPNMDQHGKMEPVRVDNIDGLLPYLSTIDWSEPWFIVLGLFHVLCITITITTINRGTIQALHFTVLLLSVYFAEFINEWAAKNWRMFARQQYFDSNGLFISVVFSTPILFNCLVIVISWLKNTGSLLSETRLMKEAKKIKEKNKEEKKNK